MLCGISPEKLFNDKDNSVSFCSFPKSSGIFPVRLFCVSSMLVKFNASTTSGNSPERSFVASNNLLRFFNMNKPLGIFPVNPFWEISKSSKETISPIDSGISPKRLQTYI
ncbi:hypothetical protein MtrunA17_Chr6g0487041 [Medicago truncatula]|uniref:Uncharacterized protein n=1 Tax=Medicago truncatula TaxID=3880 RepID=A0A396HIG6_MEDTR|nr:hypothetical protein MtrunA17_Chr6g0487041 [Medicago truncatula]